jgi:hypothetical protein
MKKFFKENWAIILILLIAVFFRFWQIKTFPNGLFPDEAANGLDINSIFHGHLQPFYERGNGREALFFYLLAASVSIFGRGPWQHHIVTGAIGVTEVFVTYLLAKRLFGKNVALLASFFMAVSSYAVALNRNGFRANTIPLFTGLTFYFLVKFFQIPAVNKKARAWAAFWAGISFGLGFYTYISYRMMPFILFALGVVGAFAMRGRWKQLFEQYWFAKKAFIIGFIIAFAWLGSYFVMHPAAIVGRAGQVSVFNKELNHGDLMGTEIMVIKKTLLSFFTQGDLNWRQNVSGWPFLAPFISPFFLVAVVWFTLYVLKFFYDAFRKRVDEQTIYKAGMATWFWFMVVPEIATAEGIPHGLRLIGVIPPIFIMSAWAVDKFWQWIRANIILNHPGRLALASIFLFIVGAYGCYAVFGIEAKSAEAYYAYRSDLTDVSNYLAQRNNKAQTYLSLDTFSEQTVDYFTTTTNNPYTVLDPANTYKVKLNKGDQVVFTMSTLFDSLKFCSSHPTAKLVVQKINQFGLTAMTVYEQRDVKGDVCKPITNPGFNTDPDSGH